MAYYYSSLADDAVCMKQTISFHARANIIARTCSVRFCACSNCYLMSSLRHYLCPVWCCMLKCSLSIGLMMHLDTFSMNPDDAELHANLYFTTCRHSLSDILVNLLVHSGVDFSTRGARI